MYFRRGLLQKQLTIADLDQIRSKEDIQKKESSKSHNFEVDGQKYLVGAQFD
jgi:hypothetical protein